MKILKKGFSLAELLIALAIISIIAIMGYSITKKIQKKLTIYTFTLDIVPYKMQSQMQIIEDMKQKIVFTK